MRPSTTWLVPLVVAAVACGGESSSGSAGAPAATDGAPASGDSGSRARAGDAAGDAARSTTDGSGPSKAGASAATGTFPLHGVALFHQVNIYSGPSSRSERLGYLRRGSRIRIGPPIEGRGCKQGRWHPTSHGGYIC